MRLKESKGQSSGDRGISRDIDFNALSIKPGLRIGLAKLAFSVIVPFLSK